MVEVEDMRHASEGWVTEGRITSVAHVDRAK